jgi:hypothetical protein
MKTKLKKAIIKTLYLSAKVTCTKAFWFLSGISFHLLVFGLFGRISNLNDLFSTTITYIILFEILYFVYLKKIADDIKVSVKDFKKILDRYENEKL